MAEESVSFNANSIQCESYVEELTKWLSCNGEVWGVGPTALFAAAAALFLYHELQASVTALGDRPRDSLIENTLIYSMVLGMLSLMVHVWVCLARFFQYYLDTLITDSPTVLLEMTKAGLRSAGVGQAQLAALGPLARFLRQQQPQIHITVCWFLALCYADYVRKNYCPGFNLPYLEEWQTELHSQTTRRVRSMLAAVGSFVGAVQARLRAVAPAPRPPDPDTVAPLIFYVRRFLSALSLATFRGQAEARRHYAMRAGQRCSRPRSISMTNLRPAATPRARPSRSLERTSRRPGAHASRRMPAQARLPVRPRHRLPELLVLWAARLTRALD